MARVKVQFGWQSGSDDQVATSRSASAKIYSVPRQYDLSTIFAVSMGYAVMFGAMRMLGFTAGAFAMFAGFVTVVGLAQALLFRGRAPRAASAVAGVAFWVTAVVGQGLARAVPVENLILGSFCCMFWGAILGYLAGVLVGSVFLLAELTRQLRRWLVTSRHP